MPAPQSKPSTALSCSTKRSKSITHSSDHRPRKRRLEQAVQAERAVRGLLEVEEEVDPGVEVGVGAGAWNAVVGMPEMVGGEVTEIEVWM